jgi:outer membrane protein OmpA-like peptidoglycan-associated protein
MRHSRTARLAALVLCVPLGVALTTGCESAKKWFMGDEFEFHCPRPAPPGLAIAVGERANSPAPALPADVRKLITEAIRGCAKITVIRVDGRPDVVDGPLVFTSAAKTEQNFAIELSDFLKKVSQRLTDAKAQEPEANVLGALSVAAGAAGPGGTVVLIDSGVQTTAPLDLRQDHLPTKKPEAIAAALRQGGLLPDLNNRTVVLGGLGYTAAPQDALDDSSRTFLVDMWSEIVRAAGAKDPILSAEPNTSPAAVTSPAVSIVSFPVGKLHLECGALSVLPDDDEVGFIPDEADFKSPDAARAVLRRFADFLNQNQDAKVEIQGFVAHYGAGNLSQRRADRVKQELISLGVRNPIEAKGMGWGPFPTPDAPPDPRYDQLNRRVTIRASCP